MRGFLFFFFVGLMMTSNVEAAPFPATSTSVLTDPAKGLFFHGFGFRLRTGEIPWKPVPEDDQSLFETLRFEPLEGTQTSTEASLSIRMDQLSGKTSLESYARKWMRDYPSYGFEILGTRPLNLGGGKGLVVDLVQRKKSKQLRQVILQKDQKVAVLTCLDDRESFKQTLSSCNEIIKSFEWAR